MLSAEQNDLITRTGAGTPAGGLMRRYWQPAALVDELAGNRPVKPVRLFGEDLVIFKDEQGPLRSDRPPLSASRHRSRLRPAGRWRPALRLSRLAVRRRRQMPARRRPSPTTAISAPTSGRNPIRSSRRAASCSPISAPASRRPFRISTASSRRDATPSPSRA